MTASLPRTLATGSGTQRASGLEPQSALRCGHPPAAADLGGHGSPRGHGEHPLHGGRVGRVAVDRSDRSQRRTATRASARRSRARARRRRSGRRPAASSSSRSDASAKQLGLAGQHGRDVALGDVVEQRQHLVADPVAAEDAGRRSTGRRTGSSPSAAQSACGLGAGAGRGAAGDRRAGCRPGRRGRRRAAG